MPILSDAFVALHAEGGQLAPEIEAEALAGATAAEATIAEGIAAGGATGGVAAGEAIAEGVEAGAAAGGAAGAEVLAAETAAGAAVAAKAIETEVAAAGTEAGAVAGSRIAAGITEGAAAGSAAMATQLEAAGLHGAGTFGAAFAKATPAIMGAVIATGLAVHEMHAAVDAAEEQEASLDKLRSTLSSNQLASTVSSKAFRDQAAALQDLTGFEDEQTEAAQAQLALFGLTGDQIREIIPLTADYARRTGKDMPEASALLGRALLGNARALKLVGINFKATGDTAADFDTIITLLRAKVGGFATEGVPELARQTAILAANWDDLQETIGHAAVPTLIEATKAADFTLEAITGTNEQLGEMGPLAQGVRAAFGNLTIGMQGVSFFSGLFNKSQEDLNATLDAGLVKLGNYANQLALSRITAGDYKEAVDRVIAGLAEEGASEEEIAQLRAGAKTIIEQYRLGLLGVAHAHETASAEARLHLASELALTGGLLGIASAADSAAGADDDLAAARAKVRQVTENGNRETKAGQQAVEDYRDAVLQDATAHGNLVGVIAKFRDEQNKAGQSTKDITGALRDQLAQSGLTRGEIDRLIDRTQAKIDKDKEVERNIVQHWKDEGLDSSTNKAKEYKRIIDGIQGAGPITVTYKTTMTQGGGPGFSSPTPTPSPGASPAPSPSPGPSRPNSTSTPTITPQVNVMLDGRTIEHQQERRRLLLGGG